MASLEKSLHQGSSLASPIPSAPHHNLAQSIRKKMETGLVSEYVYAKSLREETRFTIRMDDAYDYNILGDELDSDYLYTLMVQYGSQVAKMLGHSSIKTLADEYLLDMLSKMVFGSNYIELAGSEFDITMELCRAVFRGDHVPDTINEKDPEYARLESRLYCLCMLDDLPVSPSVEAVIKARREIVQHAKAASFIITEVYVNGEDLTERLILDTHRCLTLGIDTEQGYSWTAYSGVYRQVPVACGSTSFPDPAEVPLRMRQMISDLNDDLQAAAEATHIDPVALATKYCHIFANIHPFVDGNGRTCRLILNALLLKYGSFLSCIGQDKENREEYLAIAANASMSEQSSQDDLDSGETGAPKHYKQLASFTLKHATDGLGEFIHVLEDQAPELKFWFP